MKLQKILIGTLFPIPMFFLIANICWAAVGISWSGSLKVGDAFQAASIADSPDTTYLDSSFDLKMAINSGEKQSGVVLLKYQYQSPNQDQLQYSSSLRVYQAYLDLLLSENSILRAGRQKISWGSGFAWNPTNYIGADKNRSDLAAMNPGVDAVDYEVSRGDFSGTLALKPQDTWDVWDCGVKLSWQVWDSDISFSAHQCGDNNALGIDYATSIGNCTVYTELSTKTGSEWYIDNNNNEKKRSNAERYLHGVIGVNGTLANNWMVLLEYYYNQEGWNDQEAADYIPYWVAQSLQNQVSLSLKRGDLFGELRRNYLNLMVSKGEVIEDMALSANGMFNLDDGSFQLTPRLEYQFSQNTLFELMLNYYYGNKTSEFGSIGNMIITTVTFSF